MIYKPLYEGFLCYGFLVFILTRGSRWDCPADQHWNRDKGHRVPFCQKKNLMATQIQDRGNLAQQLYVWKRLEGSWFTGRFWTKILNTTEYNSVVCYNCGEGQQRGEINAVLQVWLAEQGQRWLHWCFSAFVGPPLAAFSLRSRLMFLKQEFDCTLVFYGC